MAERIEAGAVGTRIRNAEEPLVVIEPVRTTTFVMTIRTRGRSDNHVIEAGETGPYVNRFAAGRDSAKRSYKTMTNDGTLSGDERTVLRDRYEDLRVADVVDALDAVGYREHGQYSGFFDRNHLTKRIRPLFRNSDTFSHHLVGFAHTVRLHPTNGMRKMPRPSDDLDVDEFDDWKHEWYGDVSGAPQQNEISDGDVIVIEAHETDVGYIGSQNSLAWQEAGAVGVVTNGGCRDTDELVTQGLPVYSKYVTKTNRPGRLETDQTQVPVNVGGSLIRPEDLVVADGDGVVVVPIDHADAVADVAHDVHRRDREARTGYYERLGLEKDRTVESPDDSTD